MRELYTLELIRLVDELKGLEGLYVDQFYEVEKDKFRFKLSRKGEKANLQCILPYSLNRSGTIEIKETATDLTMAVRKRISGFKIKSIEQFGGDRIILIKLEKFDSEINLIFEMFGKGNFIITDAELKILIAYKMHVFKDRAVRPGSLYVRPRNQSINPFDKEAIKNEVENSRSQKEKNVLYYLIKKLGVGTIYVEEAMARAGLKSNTESGSLSEEKAARLSSSLIDIIKECTEKPLFIEYQDNGNLLDFSLCSISKYGDKGEVKFESLESCLDSVYENVHLATEAKNEEEEKIKASIEKQRLFLGEIDEEIAQNRRVGEKIMNNMHDLNILIERVRAKKNPTLADTKSASPNVELLSIDAKNKSIKIKLKESE